MNRVAFVSCFILGAVSLSPAQHTASGDSARIVILSPRVGAVISREEAEQYHLFGQFGGFARAVVTKLPDSSFVVWCTLGTGEESRDTLVPYSNATIAVLAEKIEHFEEIERGEYALGSRPAVLSLAPGNVQLPGGEFLPAPGRKPHAGRVLRGGPVQSSDTTGMPRFVPLGRRSSDNLPLARGPGLRMPRIYPVFGCAVGLRTLSPDLSGLKGATGSSVDFAASPMLDILPEVLLTEEIGVQCDAAYTWGEDLKCTTWGATLVLYTHPFADPGWRPFLEAGYLRMSLSGRIGDVKYTAGDGGFRVGAGIEYLLGVSTAIVIDVCYEGLGEISAQFSDIRSDGTGGFNEAQVPVNVNLSSAELGVRIKF